MAGLLFYGRCLTIAKITKAKQLTERDKAILTDLARCRVLSLEQIKNAYWPTAKERTCLERLQRLEKAGYIQSETVPGEKPGIWVRVFCLGHQGKEWATGPEGGFDSKKVFTHPGKWDEILHQVRTNEIYYRLSPTERDTFRIGDVIEVEREYYKGSGGIEIPDAAYVSDSGEEIYVEADVGHYTSAQVRAKAASFEGTRTIWVCPAGRERFLQRHGARGEFFTHALLGGVIGAQR
ncbi:Replication-relaxation [Desulfofundulus thermosubterraneus DSM 16057]|uniref:Replication-relaxation n=1 Tax=Desulfofundulus thermosubterraneus DSM 16057 TaxID=1121432 RepID=A0A1M6HAT8_9FIRM|nr:Replication-relaxation [Desulfofundulus thermosubterraneus DSM 16057]